MRSRAVFLLSAFACAALFAVGAELRLVAGQSGASALPGCDPANGGITLPDGFCAVVFADKLGMARHLTVAPNGDVFVRIRQAEGAKAGIGGLRDTDGDGRADRQEWFSDNYGTGIQLRNGYLYYSTDDAVYRYRLPPGQLRPEGAPEPVVTGFPQQRSHASKPIAFDESGHMYVTVGAPSNNCQEKTRTPGVAGMKPCPQLERQASIWRFDANRTGQTQQKDGHKFVTGIRQVVALEWNPSAKAVYLVQHGRDQVNTLWPDLYNEEQNAEIPSEEFHRLSDGANFGWPYCFHDPLLGRRVLAPEYGGDGKKTDGCEKYPDPLVAFPGHWGPNDLIFYTAEQFPARYRHGAFIAFHGSWNRAPLPQGGYRVVFVPMNASGQVTGQWETFADGFPGQTPLMDRDAARHRPTGLAIGPDGSLYVSDSKGGRIWRVMYRAGATDQ